MTVKSMTGFSRVSGEGAGFSWVIEIKSVNNKGLDVRAKVPSFLDGFDQVIKKTANQMLGRGSVFINMNIQRSESSEVCRVDEDRLKTLLDLAEKYQDAKGVNPPSLDGLLAVKGVVEIVQVETSEDERNSLEGLLLDDLKDCIKALVEARSDEGARIQKVLEDQLDAMTGYASDAEEAASDRIETMRKRFASQMEKLSNVAHPVSEERLAQEIAILAVKADIREELDRLKCHFEEAGTLIASEKPVGRRLDFLCQEFNREANTLCSKAGDVALTRIGLDLKTTIDQFREQVQNIE